MTTIATPETTPKFLALVAVLQNEAQAITVWNRQYPDQRIGEAPAPEVDEPRLPEGVAALVAAGFTQDEAFTLVGSAPEPAPAPTSRELAEALVEAQGLTFTKGRIYSTTPIIEAQARVLKTGEPEIVSTDGSRRTSAVLVFRMDDGTSVAVQNLTTPKGTA